MALLDRFNIDTCDPDDPQRNKLSGGQFLAGLTEWGMGHYTRQWVIDTFNIHPDDEADMDWLKGKYQDATQKERFSMVVRNQIYLLEGGQETSANVVQRISDASAGVNMGSA